jgi:hypothetical protein
VLVGKLATFDQHLRKLLIHNDACDLQAGNPLDYVNGQTEAIDFIFDVDGIVLDRDIRIELMKTLGITPVGGGRRPLRSPVRASR